MGIKKCKTNVGICHKNSVKVNHENDRSTMIEIEIGTLGTLIGQNEV